MRYTYTFIESVIYLIIINVIDFFTNSILKKNDGDDFFQVGFSMSYIKNFSHIFCDMNFLSIF